MKKIIIGLSFLFCFFLTNVSAEEMLKLNCKLDSDHVLCEVNGTDDLQLITNLDYNLEVTNANIYSMSHTKEWHGTMSNERGSLVSNGVNGKSNILSFNLIPNDKSKSISVKVNNINAYYNETPITNLNLSASILPAELNNYKGNFDSTKLSRVSVVGTNLEFKPDVFEYTVFVPVGTTNVYIEAISNNSNAVIKGTGYVDITNQKDFIVTSSYGSLKDTRYLIHIKFSYTKYFIIGGFIFLTGIALYFLIKYLLYKKELKRLTYVEGNYENLDELKNVLDVKKEQLHDEELSETKALPVINLDSNVQTQSMPSAPKVINLDTANTAEQAKQVIINLDNLQ